MSTDKKPLMVLVPVYLHDLLKDLAVSERRTVTAVVTQMIVDGLIKSGWDGKTP